VALILLDVARGHLRGAVLCWVVLVTLAYDTGAFLMSSSEIPGLALRQHLPEILALGGLLVIVADMMRGRIRWYLLGSVVLLMYGFVNWPFVSEPFWSQFPILFWQLVLVSTGVGLAAAPLLSYVQQHSPSGARRSAVAPALVTSWSV
jgi:hypothetical protein